MADFLSQPHGHPLRRVLFQLHLWLGLVIGLHLAIVSLTGSLLVFRPDLQRMAFPQLLAHTHEGPPADIAGVLEALRTAYPGQQILGVDAPTVYRRAFLAYVIDGKVVHTVLADPASGSVLGELPTCSWVATLQSLHFELLLGRTGRVLNQVTTLGLLGLAFSGALVWWQGRGRWRRGLRVRGGPWPVAPLRNLHSAAGAWGWGLVFMIAISTSALVFPRQVRMLAMWVTSTPAPASPAAVVAETPQQVPRASLDAAAIVQAAQAQYPGQHIARLVPPSATAPTYVVGFADRQPTPLAPAAVTSRHFDPHTGQQVGPDMQPSHATSLVAWGVALHVGNFAGTGTRVLWALLGLVPPLLFVTGALMWWRRVVRPWRAR